MRLRALLTTVTLGVALLAPPLAGAADRHRPRDGDRGHRSSYRHAERYRSAHPRYRDDRAYSHGRYRPSRRSYAPRHGYYVPRYRYQGPRYGYGPYLRRYYEPLYPVPVYPYGGYYSYDGYYPGGYYSPYPPLYRRGVHGGIHLGFPGFALGVYF